LGVSNILTDFVELQAGGGDSQLWRVIARIMRDCAGLDHGEGMLPSQEIQARIALERDEPLRHSGGVEHLEDGVGVVMGRIQLTWGWAVKEFGVGILS